MANFDSAGYKAALVARGVSSEEADARVAAYLSSPQARADSASFQGTQGPQPGAMRTAAASEQTRAGVQAPEQGYGGLAEPMLSLLPLAGGAAMGALGAPLGPAGMAAGAGLGAAGGEAGRQLIARALGLPAPETAGDAAQKIGWESLMGGAGTYVPAKAMEFASPAIAGAASRLPKFLARRIPFLRDAADLGELMGGSGSAASRTAEAAAPAAGAAAAASVEGAAPPGMKAATDYWRRRAFAIMEQAKVPADAEAQRAAMSEALGRNVSTRSGLSIEDWMKVHDAMGERIAQNAAKEAGEKAAASAARRGVRTANKAAREATKAGKPALQVVEGGAPVTSGSGEDKAALAGGNKIGQGARQVASDLEKKHPGLTLEMAERTGAYGNKVWSVDAIVVPKDVRGQGIGTKAMEAIIAAADREGATLTLKPSTDFGGSSVARLRRFYGRFGFRRNLGARSDPSLPTGMFREPVTVKPKAPASGSAASRVRGASAPELARRTTARGAAIGGEATTEVPGQLEEALRRSLEAERQMDAMGLTPEQRGIARRLLRGQ